VTFGLLIYFTSKLGNHEGINGTKRQHNFDAAINLFLQAGEIEFIQT